MTPLPGYVCLVSKRHVREPFQLPPGERESFWQDVDAVARVLDEGLRPDKLNYEIHGNTVPHLHLHLFPRTRNDRFTGRPIDGSDAVERPQQEHRHLVALLSTLVSR
jgi:diadenosine tetraphosphate (Ap4A) HIT family hydrolase